MSYNETNVGRHLRPATNIPTGAGIVPHCSVSTPTSRGNKGTLLFAPYFQTNFKGRLRSKKLPAEIKKYPTVFRFDGHGHNGTRALLLVSCRRIRLGRVCAGQQTSRRAQEMSRQFVRFEGHDNNWTRIQCCLPHCPWEGFAPSKKQNTSRRGQEMPAMFRFDGQDIAFCPPSPNKPWKAFMPSKKGPAGGKKCPIMFRFDAHDT